MNGLAINIHVLKIIPLYVIHDGDDDDDMIVLMLLLLTVMMRSTGEDIVGWVGSLVVIFTKRF